MLTTVNHILSRRGSLFSPTIYKMPYILKPQNRRLSFVMYFVKYNMRAAIVNNEKDRQMRIKNERNKEKNMVNKNTEILI